MSVSVLHVEDNLAVARNFSKYLMQRGIVIKKHIVSLEEFEQFEKLEDKDEFDIILVDLFLSEDCEKAEGIEIIKRVKKFSDADIIVLSNFGHTELVDQALNLGAIAYEMKMHPECIFWTIKKILTYNYPLKTFISEHRKMRIELFMSQFTDSEKEIIVHMRNGLTQNEIEKEVNIPHDTLKSRFKKINKKIGAETFRQAREKIKEWFS